MRFFLPLLLCVGIAHVHAQNDEVTTSPRQTFKIVQHYQDTWKQTLQFIKEPNHVITLEEEMPWPALYYVSPDEHWILRIQKSGSGDNISFLYHLDRQGRLSRNKEQVGALGFAYLDKQPGLPRNLYHTGIAFKAWDLKAGLLRFTIEGSDANQSGNGVHRSLAYNLHDETIVPR